jgi:hypothetical protein
MLSYKSSRRFQFEAGISYGRLVSSKEEDNAGEIGNLADRKKFNNYEIGFLFGMNYMVFENFYLNLQVSNSILPIREYEPGAYKIERDQYNSGLLFTFKYIFRKSAAAE